MYIGYHDQDVPKAKINRKVAAKWQYALAVTYNPVVCLVKASFLWSLQKLRSRNIAIRRCLWAIQLINAAYLIAALILNLVPCLPVSRQFDKTIKGKCYDAYNFVVGTICVVLITDAMVLVMPSWIIYDLQMPLRRKLITISFLSLGFVVIAIGILRLHWLSQKFKGHSKSYSIEQSYSAMECNIAIIGACGPTVKYILGGLIPSLRPENHSKKASNYGHSSSNQGISRRQRSKYDTNTYDDLDMATVRQDEIEMKGDWRWRSKNDSDANSDEQRMTTDMNDGIMKTVDWTVSSREDSMAGRLPVAKDAHSDVRVAVQPANVV
ncbi:uncharacterized protein BDR25DRAFT_243108 [Lindgomyces ingoldianus]|uniref:Uncharacterized protein n=1 Tax=Lindgomyces ingoldianus TaxID=673940 RepID=A0ACB6QAV7_9PLEO|nr:uncharacterized protein BDR25DRAFT_243108 [Lindgomyces ingoldianus]KAF2464174.1 hypothetical protein BDR25DRAFT_243108 [Lindgomyces ingoldianus]